MSATMTLPNFAEAVHKVHSVKVVDKRYEPGRSRPDLKKDETLVGYTIRMPSHVASWLKSFSPKNQSTEQARKIIEWGRFFGRALTEETQLTQEWLEEIDDDVLESMSITAAKLVRFEVQKIVNLTNCILKCNIDKIAPEIWAEVLERYPHVDKRESLRRWLWHEDRVNLMQMHEDLEKLG